MQRYIFANLEKTQALSFLRKMVYVRMQILILMLILIYFISHKLTPIGGKHIGELPPIVH